MDNLVYHKSCLIYPIIYDFSNLIMINQTSTIKAAQTHLGLEKVILELLLWVSGLRNWLVSMRMWVQFLALLGGLRIWHCCVGNLQHCSQQCQILSPWCKARDWTHILMDTGQVCYCWATMETSKQGISDGACCLSTRWHIRKTHPEAVRLVIYSLHKHLFLLALYHSAI